MSYSVYCWCVFSPPIRYFSFLVECKNPKACTILLRGASKEILMEVERNLQDAMNVARNVLLEPLLVPGGGAAEMAVSQVGCYRNVLLEPLLVPGGGAAEMAVSQVGYYNPLTNSWRYTPTYSTNKVVVVYTGFYICPSVSLWTKWLQSGFRLITLLFSTDNDVTIHLIVMLLTLGRPLWISGTNLEFELWNSVSYLYYLLTYNDDTLRISCPWPEGTPIDFLSRRSSVEFELCIISTR